MGKRFAKCILHIGIEKTGTTTLQAFLHLNRTMLTARGYFVPASLAPHKALANHEALTTLALDPAKLNDDLRRKIGLKTAADIAAHRAAAEQGLRAEMSAFPFLPPALLLSNEHCHSRLISAGEVRTLHAFLAEFAEDFEVIVYLRPQHELATSLYDQAIKAGYADIDVLPDFAGQGPRWVERRYFDYDDLLSRWSDVFGRQKLRPRIFARDRLACGSIVDDFLAAIGCDGTKMDRPKDRNTSISAPFQHALGAVNRYQKRHPQVTPRARARLIALLQRLSTAGGRRPSRAAAMAFYASFAESNERVRRDFFPRQSSLFEPDFSAYPEQAADQGPETDALIQALLALALHEVKPAG